MHEPLDARLLRLAVQEAAVRWVHMAVFWVQHTVDGSGNPKQPPGVVLKPCK